jgi:hypothetical protein
VVPGKNDNGHDRQIAGYFYEREYNVSLSTIYSKQEVGLSEEVTIDRILRRQAAKTPNAIAIAPTVGKPLTYRGLVDQVDYVAHSSLKVGLPTRTVSSSCCRTVPRWQLLFLGSRVARSALH